MAIRKTTNEFIRDANLVHGNRYNYTRVSYAGQSIPVEIICSSHGSFYQKPKLHLIGNSCRSCADESRRGDALRFVQRARNRHNMAYDYSRIRLEVGWKNSIEIGCPDHGWFFLKIAKNHVSTIAQGCPACAKSKISEQKQKQGWRSFLTKSTNIHGSKYDYSLVEWDGFHNPVTIVCPQHGNFRQRPTNHSTGHGCWACAKQQVGYSKGEHIIREELIRGSCTFIEEFSLENCRNPKTGYFFRYDFCLTDRKIIIEFDGSHHYNEGYFTSNVSLDEIKWRDKFKTACAVEMGYSVIRFAKLTGLRDHIRKIIEEGS